MDRLYAAHAAAVTFYRAQLIRHEGPVGYLRDRGLGALVDRDRPWRVGYAPHAWTALVDHLRRRGFTAAETCAAGLARTTADGRVVDLFHDRILFPIRDLAGNTVAFIGRIWPPDGAPGPKYINSPDTPIYTKGQHLFGLDQQKDRAAAGWVPILVEGPADAVAVWLCYGGTGGTGFVAAATCGTAFTGTQAATIAGVPGAQRHGVVIAFDADQPGQDAADRVYRLLAPRVPAVSGVVLPAGTDPADLLPNGRLRDLLDAPARPYLHLLLRHRLDRLLDRYPRMLHEVDGRVAAARALAPLIAEEPPAAAVAATRDLIAHARLRLGPDGPRLAGDLLVSLTLATARHLEEIS